MLDIVANHGSPSWDMRPVDQPKFGEIFEEDGELVADHENLRPDQLDPANIPLHGFFNKSGNLAQLSDLNENNPQVLEYLSGAYLKWIDHGVDAFRIDTITWMPHTFWKAFADRIRAEHPGFYMFGENFNFDAGAIAQHQRPENGGISVLDFPGRSSITGVFENPTSDYGNIQGYLHLTDCVYTNPYELTTFYDNHDMARMKASENGFIDAHNWLFTARGIPVIYYGSEMRFMNGKVEHQGNRNYYGPQNIAAARNGEVFKRLARIADVRKQSVALQKGLQENLLFEGHKAAFYRVYQRDGVNQTALVLLNKGDQAANFTVDQFVSAGQWRNASTGEALTITPNDRVISTSVGPHDVQVLLFDQPVNHPELVTRLHHTAKVLKGCRLPRVEVTPDPLIAAGPVTVLYREAPDKRFALRWGINNWGGTSTAVSEDPMAFDADASAHRVALTIPPAATQLDFVFHNLTSNTWDNNGGRDYHYRVLSRVLDPPANQSATPGDRAVVLAWQPVSNATGYAVYFTDDGSDPTKGSARLTSEGSSLTHSDLTNGVRYRYRLAASNEHGESALSDVVTAVPGPSFESRFPKGSVLRLTGQAFSGWNPSNDQYLLHMVGDYTWSGTVAVASELVQTPYKLTLDGTWTVNWGGGGAGRDAQLPRGGANATVSLGTGTYTLMVTEGTSVGSAMQVTWIGAGDPVLSVDPASKQLTLAKGSRETFNIELSNAGGGELLVSAVSTDVPWITATLKQGEGLIAATVDTADLSIGETAIGTVTVASSGGDRTVTVRLTVTQPTQVVAVTFTCENGHTYIGQSVYVLGSTLALGTWTLENAIKLDPTAYPTWTGQVALPADTNFEWKCVKREEKNPRAGVGWQPGPNNSLCTRPSCPRPSVVGSDGRCSK